MTHGVRHAVAGLLASLVLTGLINSTFAQDVRPKTIMRVFWQDQESAKLSYADLVATSKWNLNRGWVKDFIQPAADESTLGPMQTVAGRIVICVNNNDGSSKQAIIDSGVFEEPHGNHFHWRYSKKPTVFSVTSADKPVREMLANDRMLFVVHETDGTFSRTNPRQLKAPSTEATAQTWTTYDVGATASSIAFKDQSTAFLALAGEQNEAANRVGVVDLRKEGSDCITGTIQLPHGGVQDSVACQGKIFHATDGGLWFHPAVASPQQSQIKQVLADDDSAADALATSNLTSELNWVLATTGTGKDSALLLINASAAVPKARELQIPAADGLAPSRPRIVLSLGKRYAFVFQGRTSAEQTAQELLTVVELDPNRDRSFADARIKASIPIGASKLDGTAGRHDICFDAYGRYAVITDDMP